ncbi:hypothetical protein Q31b_17890 [Novipirellula aureliae]|uniref:Uncharacterized protein n=1 Tax=Novipirellula aureliae TaxID=2527966 RepID=A0A5C6E3J9_9BACT|nr:hypothetical protein Q31b_17890 [Novipirellula aureliae]
MSLVPVPHVIIHGFLRLSLNQRRIKKSYESAMLRLRIRVRRSGRGYESSVICLTFGTRCLVHYHYPKITL